MQDSQFQTISVDNLELNITNPRYAIQASEHQILDAIVEDQGMKLVRLAEDIAEKGPNPAVSLLVSKNAELDSYKVLDGNRRVAAIKLASSEDLINAVTTFTRAQKKRFIALANQTNNRIPEVMRCSLVSPEEANHWIELIHAGELGGTGVVPWNTYQLQRFLGNPPPNQIIDLVTVGPYIDDETRKKLPGRTVTTIERIIKNAEAASILGISIKDNKVILPTDDDGEVLERLSLLVTEITLGNITSRTTNKDDEKKSQAEKIVEAISIKRGKLPKKQSKDNSGNTDAGTSNGNAAAGAGTTNGAAGGNSGGSSGNGNAGAGASNGNAAAGAGTANGTAGGGANNGSSTETAGENEQKNKKSNANRKTLIPDDFNVTIPHKRIRDIFNELKQLDANKFANSGAVMLRVFIELSADAYAGTHNLKFDQPVLDSAGKPEKKKDGTTRIDYTPLPTKIQKVADDLESTGVDPKKLKGIRMLINEKNHVLSVESLHSYVHNMHVDPNPVALQKNWNSIDEFIRLLWP